MNVPYMLPYAYIPNFLYIFPPLSIVVYPDNSYIQVSVLKYFT